MHATACCFFFLVGLLVPLSLWLGRDLFAGLTAARFYLSAVRQYRKSVPAKLQRVPLRTVVKTAWGHFRDGMDLSVECISLTMRDGSRYEKTFLGYARRVM